MSIFAQKPDQKTGQKTGQKTIAIIGAGCAGWSLAARADQLSASRIELFKKQDNHASQSWGFWQMPWLLDAVSQTRKKWNKWQIITHDGSAEHHSVTHPYCSLQSDVWIKSCTQKFLSAKTQTSITELPVRKTEKNRVITSEDKSDFDVIYDSRPPVADTNILLQHFRGFEIRAAKPVFNPEVAILMDFRVSQENGIHFMYVLGYDEYTALVESTFFSLSPHRDKIYETAIREYLNTVFHLDDFEIIHSESGVIPMGRVSRKDSNPFLLAIGSNAGAIRPSSGYAFSFIQKQIEQLTRQNTNPKSPHKKYDLWMDSVFLSVLKSNPEKAPTLFLKLAKSLSGDAFARFLSGDAKITDYALVIYSMPKWLFICHAFKVIMGLQQRTTR